MHCLFIFEIRLINAGDCSQDSFLRFEGTVDHTIDMIYTWDSDRLSKINKQELINWNAQADELVRSGVDV